MKREILYRGKSLDSGEWVYGCPRLCGWTGEWLIYPPQCMIGARVDPSTIGEYTGCDDADGNKIFEGDILDSKCFENNVDHKNDPCEVSWFEDGWECDTAYECGFTLCTVLGFGAKVVGNIHDDSGSYRF